VGGNVQGVEMEGVRGDMREGGLEGGRKGGARSGRKFIQGQRRHRKRTSDLSRRRRNLPKHQKKTTTLQLLDWSMESANSITIVRKWNLERKRVNTISKD